MAGVIRVVFLGKILYSHSAFLIQMGNGHLAGESERKKKNKKTLGGGGGLLMFVFHHYHHFILLYIKNIHICIQVVIDCLCMSTT